MGENWSFSLGIIILCISLFFSGILWFIHKVHKDFGMVPLYDRSFNILKLAYLGNYIQTVFIIGSGIIWETKKQFINTFGLFVTFPAIYGARLYAASIAIRIYRIIILHGYREGLVSEEKMENISKLSWILKITNFYSIISTFMFIFFYFVFGVDGIHTRIFIQAVYCFEAAVLIIMSYKVFESKTHPTIILEYLAYAVLWAPTGTFTSDFSLRWLYIIPIRNLGLLIISAESLYEHCKVIRPPLPLTIELSHIFEIKELYSDFHAFILKKNDNSLDETCELYKEYSKALYLNNYQHFLTICQKFDSVNQEEKNSEWMFLCEQKKEILENNLLQVLNDYFLSYQFFYFKKQYFINFD